MTFLLHNAYTSCWFCIHLQENKTIYIYVCYNQSFMFLKFTFILSLKLIAIMNIELFCSVGIFYREVVLSCFHQRRNVTTTRGTSLSWLRNYVYFLLCDLKARNWLKLRANIWWCAQLITMPVCIRRCIWYGLKIWSRYVKSKRLGTSCFNVNPFARILHGSIKFAVSFHKLTVVCRKFCGLQVTIN